MNMMLGGAIASQRSTRRKTTSNGPARSTTACTLLLAPFSHVSGYAQLLLMMYVSGRIVLLERWHMPYVLSLIERERVRSFCGATPANLRELTRADRSTYDISSVSAFQIHGAALHGNLIAELKLEFPDATISTGYGLTETSGSICVAAGADLLNRPESCGEVLPGVDIRLVDPCGSDVPPGARGEILLRGAMTMQGYCGLSADAPVVANGWLRTGDVARLDSQGYLYVLARRDEMLTVAGTQITSLDVERAAASYEGVDEAAALGAVRSTDGEQLILAVTLKGHSSLNAEELHTHIHRCLGTPIPLRVLVHDRFPRTASGKIDRQTLRQPSLFSRHR
jgi:acyl-CoA synthetase (AMP-forming)/AMP-acid ligase II